MLNIKHINNESGIAMVIALVMLLALTVIGISSLMTSTLDVQMSGNERRTTEALNLADSGVEMALHDLLYDYKHDPVTSWANNNLFRLDLSSGSQVTNTIGAAAGDFDVPTDGQWGDPFGATDIGGGIGNAVDLYGVQDLGIGKYRVLFLRDPGEPDEVYARSYAQHNTGARKIVQLHLSMNKVDVWRNAVFAGRGSASASVTGNINVAGSMHILGTGDTNDYSISGNAGIFNGYKDLGSSAGFSYDDLIGRVDMSTLEISGYTADGDPIYSLEAELRVKNVTVSVTGSGTIGEDGTIDVDGENGNDTSQYGNDYWKADLDGIYANNDIVGSSVYSDNSINGEYEAYDLGDKLQMPAFNDQYIDNDGNTWDTYEEYIDTNSLVIPAATACDLIPDSASGPTATTGFILGDENTDGECTEADTAINGTGCIKWNPGTGSDDATIGIAGRVSFDNDNCSTTIGGHSTTPYTQIGENGQTITYEGKGLLYTAKSMYMDGSMVTDDSDGGKFIQDDLMGFLTKNNIHMAESGNPNAVMMGAFYAQGLISTESPSQIMGSLVSNLFCLGGTKMVSGELVCDDSGGGTASDIFYVPELSDEVQKLGMIRGRLIFTFDEYDWEQVW